MVPRSCKTLSLHWRQASLVTYAGRSSITINVASTMAFFNHCKISSAPKLHKWVKQKAKKKTNIAYKQLNPTIVRLFPSYEIEAAATLAVYSLYLYNNGVVYYTCYLSEFFGVNENVKILVQIMKLLNVIYINKI